MYHCITDHLPHREGHGKVRRRAHGHAEGGLVHPGGAVPDDQAGQGQLLREQRQAVPVDHVAVPAGEPGAVPKVPPRAHQVPGQQQQQQQQRVQY